MSERAASLVGVDFDRIKSKSVEAASELEKLGTLIDKGVDSEADFGRLCEILVAFGEVGKATELLIANVDKSDANFVRFRHLLAQPESTFRTSVESFEVQFSTKLTLFRSVRFLDGVYRCEPPIEFGDEVHITYGVDGQVVADVYNASSFDAVALRLTNGSWTQA